MNTLAYGIILMGVTSGYALRYCGKSLCEKIAASACVGTILFGLGLTLEAFFPTERGDFSPVAILSGFGGTLVLCSFASWGFVFVWGYRRG
jgi:hypothetical protein